MNNKLFYTKLAKYYDKIYHYIDYNKQASFFIKLIKKYNKSKNNKILDVACGTGIHADLLQKQGFDIIGLDISEDMLKEAKKKNSKVKFIKGDMKKLDLNEKFGAIICFFNSILYNKDKKEMKKTLTNFYNHLEKTGILIFDAVDKSIGINSKKEEYKYEDDNLKISFRPQWIYNQETNIMDLDIDFIINNKKLHEHHIMGAFSFDELKQILKKVGFEVIEILSSANKHAIFMCRR
jgi:ubiquinone/menaquinone biosynthesis C-methylase UbiE